MLRFKSLGSGSSGNATVVEAGSGSGRTRLLVDCGMGLSQLEVRLGQAGLHLSQVDAIFVTHEHGDHVGCLEKLLRKHAKSVWMSHGTHLGMGAPDLGPLLHLAQDGTPIDLGNLQLHPFTVPHDAREPLQLSVTDGSVRLGIVTDLGHVTPHVAQQLQGCQAVMLECNHDPGMLASSSYPPFLKRRVAGQLGHLSNEQAAALAQALCHDGLRHLVASHLSERNNVPELARNMLAAATGRLPQDIGVADPVQGTDWLHA